VKHFPEQVWADFVRGLGTTETKGLDAHLAKGCPDCIISVGVWKKIASIASREPSLSPPDGVVRMAKMEFAATSSAQQEPWAMARLVFDSLRQPLTAGVRSGAPEARQLMFDAEGTMVDLVLDVQPQARTITLVGQVVDKSGAKVAARQVSVILWAETGQPLAQAAANEFGEFQMEFAAQERLRLSVEIVGYKHIHIPPLNLTPDEKRPVT